MLVHVSNIRRLLAPWRLKRWSLLSNWHLLRYLVDLNFRESPDVKKQEAFIQQSRGRGVFKCV